MKKIVVLVVIVLALVLGYFVINNKGEEEILKTDGARFKEEYESLNGTKREKDGHIIRTIEIDEMNKVKYATADEIVEKIENGESFAVYFGFSDCPWCRSVVPTMLQVVEDLNLEEIYYVDVKEIRDVYVVENGELKVDKKGTDGYYKLLEKFDEVLSDYKVYDEDKNEYDTEEKRIYAPNIAAVVEGEVNKLTNANSDKQTDAYMELTEEMLNESYEKIKCTLDCLSKTAGVCTKKNAC